MRLRRQKSRHKAPAPLQLEAAYGVCRSISRASARNFYYGFLALPREKRNAICAVYAFMRHADDIADEPGMAADKKRAQLAAWLERLQRVSAGEATDDPVLLALADAQRRFRIPLLLLEKLVAGTTMDLDRPLPETSATTPSRTADGGSDAGDLGGRPGSAAQAGGSPAAIAEAPGAALVPQYETFDGLYEYCYHVASVVGLVCIRIFGYHDPAAERLAEHCGIAFQLTNIIRDVKEDALMGRVYLPREDLERFGVTAQELATGAAARVRPLLEFEAERAREFYRAANQLLPLIDEDSRPALWSLVTIYRSLLEKIAARNYDVFSGRVRLSFRQKLSVLARGLWQRIA
jgi:phytoene synthase